jgi:hypothetical protein
VRQQPREGVPFDRSRNLAGYKKHRSHALMAGNEFFIELAFAYE